MNPLWKKYGLMVDEENIRMMFHYHSKIHPINRDDVDRYITLVTYCHHSVADFWESNLGSQKLPYFNVVDMVAKKWGDEAVSILEKYGMMVGL